MSDQGPDFDGEGYVLPGSPIGPRMGLTLWCAARVIVARNDFEPLAVVEGLPVVARTFVNQPAWRAQLHQCFRTVRDRLAVADLPLARSTGEEYALHLIISAGATLEARGHAPAPEEFGMQLLPDPDDRDYVAAHQSLLAGSDLLLLFDPLMDGIEDEHSLLNRRLRIGPLLHPARWFEPLTIR